MIIYYCERIEFILSELQIRQQKRKIANLETSQNSFRNFWDTSNNDNEFLKILLLKFSIYLKTTKKVIKRLTFLKNLKILKICMKMEY